MDELRSQTRTSGPGTRNAEAAASDRPATTGPPRWVKAFLVVGVLVVILLFAVEHLVFERLPGGGMSHTGNPSAPAAPGSGHGMRG